MELLLVVLFLWVVGSSSPPAAEPREPGEPLPPPLPSGGSGVPPPPSGPPAVNPSRFVSFDFDGGPDQAAALERGKGYAQSAARALGLNIRTVAPQGIRVFARGDGWRGQFAVPNALQRGRMRAALERDPALRVVM